MFELLGCILFFLMQFLFPDKRNIVTYPMNDFLMFLCKFLHLYYLIKFRFRFTGIQSIVKKSIYNRAWYYKPAISYCGDQILNPKFKNRQYYCL